MAFKGQKNGKIEASGSLFVVHTRENAYKTVCMKPSV